MPDFDYLRKKCNEQSAISESVIDDFMLHYAARKDNLSKEFDSRFSKYKHAIAGMPASWVNMIKSQYIIHRVFKTGGLITRYLNHAAVKALGGPQKDYLISNANNPWKFSFSQIVSNPEKDFYEMEDVFSGQRFLLYSRSVTTSLKERPALTWFNLVSYNGACWQSFGPVISLSSLSPDDIFFFGTELNTKIEQNEDLLNDIESNPVPYMMLATGSAYPLVMSGEHEVVQVTGESVTGSFNQTVLNENFTVEFADGVFRITDASLSEPPHFATAYYDEEDGITFLTSLTDHGYEKFVKALNMLGFELPEYPDVRVHLHMITLISKILKKDVVLDPYGEIFTTASSPETVETMDKLNHFLALALPVINSGKMPDVDALAKNAGIDPEEAKEILQVTMGKIEEMRKR